MAVHHLDAVLQRMGTLPAAVSADASGDGLRGEVTAEWAHGVRLTYRFREDAPGYRHAERIDGTRGFLTVEDQRVRLHRPGRRPRRVRAATGDDPEGPVLETFLRATSGAPVDTLGARENLATLAFVEAAERSSVLRRAVDPAEILEEANLEAPHAAPISS